MGSRGEHAGAEITPQWEIADADTMRKRSVVIAGHRTSVSLETGFWAALKEIADLRCVSVNRLVESIDSARATNLSSAIRLFVLRWYRDQTVRDAALPH